MSKCEFDLNQWRQVFLLSADNALVPSDEAPPVMECDDSNETDQPLSSIPSSTVKKPVVGRPSGSHKRLSDGTCKKTTNKTIDEIVELIAAKAEYHNSPFTLLQLVNERCKLKWRNNMKTANSGDVPVGDACAMMYNLNLSSHQYQELRLFLMKYKFIIPPRNNNDIYKKSLLPNITTETMKTYCNIKDLITNTVSSLLVTCNWNNPPPSALSITSKFGLDGSGCHNTKRLMKKMFPDPPLSITLVHFGVLCN